MVLGRQGALLEEEPGPVYAATLVKEHAPSLVEPAIAGLERYGLGEELLGLPHTGPRGILAPPSGTRYTLAPPFGTRHDTAHVTRAARPRCPQRFNTRPHTPPVPILLHDTCAIAGPYTTRVA